MDIKYKIYTASFYQVRNMTPNMIPMSTAAGEPAWFHDNVDKVHTFIDKNGVYNGLRAEPFLLDTYKFDMIPEDKQCSKDCNQIPGQCPFMKIYRESIEKHSFEYIITYLQEQAENIKNLLKFKEEPIIVLLVYEAPSCQCAERVVIQNYFKDHGYEVEEWTPDLVYKYKLF